MSTFFNLSQPIVYVNGTMQPAFADFIRQVNLAIDGSELVAVWSGITGTLSEQTDLQDALDLKSDTTHVHAAADVTSGTFADARVSESSVTQHEAALSIAWTQVTGKVYLSPTFEDDASDPYTLVVGDANKVKRFTAADPAITIPTGTFAVGNEVSIRQAGTGTLALTTTSLTINGSIPAWSQHVETKFRYVATDTWDVV